MVCIKHASEIIYAGYFFIKKLSYVGCIGVETTLRAWAFYEMIGVFKEGKAFKFFKSLIWDANSLL